MQKIQKSYLRNSQGWIQTVGGVTILFILPIIGLICSFPKIQVWAHSTFMDAQPSSLSTVPTTKTMASRPEAKQQSLPESIFKIAEVSEVEPDDSKTESVPPSELSHAISQLHRALQARPHSQIKDVLNSANRLHAAASPQPCPFEWIGSEGSLVLSHEADGGISLVKTLNRCAEAVEQTTLQGH